MTSKAPLAEANGEQKIDLTVPKELSGVRLDHFLVQTCPEHYSRSQIVNAIKAGLITVNHKTAKQSYRLHAEDHIEGKLVLPGNGAPPTPQDVPFDIMYEDDDLIVVDKPAGLVVHPGSGNPDKTLVNGLIHRFNELKVIGDQQRPGIVHRLDKDTSGLLVVARSQQAHAKLSAAFKERAVDKQYITLVHGSPDDENGNIVMPIGRHPVHRQKMTVREIGGRFAASNWKVLKRFGRFTLLEVTIETGRTHQIRVHLSAIGYPVVGDQLYGGSRDNTDFDRQLLHAWRLRFRQPFSGVMLKFEAPLPADFQRSIDRLEQKR